MMSYTFLGYLNGTCDADSSQSLGKKAVFFSRQRKRTKTHRHTQKKIKTGCHREQRAGHFVC